jgi:hypothetical protein
MLHSQRKISTSQAIELELAEVSGKNWVLSNAGRKRKRLTPAREEEGKEGD